MTRRVLSERTGITIEAIQAIEAGTTKHPRAQTIAQLREALGVSWEAISGALLAEGTPV